MIDTVPETDKSSAELALHRAYSCILDHTYGIPVDEVAQTLGLTVPEARSLVGQLLDMGLLRSTRPDGHVIAVAPSEAAAAVLAPLERAARLQRSRIDEMQNRILSFTQAFKESTGAGGSPFRVLDCIEEESATIADLMNRCSKEVLIAQPGGGRDQVAPEARIRHDKAALARGVRMQILHQHATRFSRSSMSYADQVTELGAKVRTLDDQFTRMLIFDREAVLLCIPERRLASALLTEPHVVAFAVETYERLWLSAAPLATRHGTRVEVEIAEDLQLSIIRLLSEGMTDASIAMRLGLSVRTIRRYIAEHMASLGANSRFQAGYLCRSRLAEEMALTRSPGHPA